MIRIKPMATLPKKTKEKQLEVQQAIIVSEEMSLDKPQQDTQFAQAAAAYLVDIIKKNNWSRKLGGQSEHIQYEGWQTAGKFYGYTVKTFDAEFIKFDDAWGFKAKAIVVNEKTGIEVGGAEALCTSDEANWKSKPKFQLASMAQTRAGSKALRQILGFVVALAGYSATPAEEMIGNEQMPTVAEKPQQAPKETATFVGDLKCSSCDDNISEKVDAYSRRQYGKPLCMPCQAKEKEKNSN